MTLATSVADRPWIEHGRALTRYRLATGLRTFALTILSG